MADVEKHFTAVLGLIGISQTNDFVKIILTKLQNLVWIRYVGVPSKDTNMATREVGQEIN